MFTQITNIYNVVPHAIGEALWRPFQQDEKSLNSKACFTRKGKKHFWDKEEKAGRVIRI